MAYAQTCHAGGGSQPGEQLVNTIMVKGDKQEIQKMLSRKAAGVNQHRKKAKQMRSSRWFIIATKVGHHTNASIEFILEVMHSVIRSKRAKQRGTSTPTRHQSIIF